MTGFRANWTENPCKLNRKRSGGKNAAPKMGAAHCKAGKKLLNHDEKTGRRTPAEPWEPLDQSAAALTGLLPQLRQEAVEKHKSESKAAGAAKPPPPFSCMDKSTNQFNRIFIK